MKMSILKARYILLLVAVAGTACFSATAQTKTDSLEVRQAIQNYVDAIYKADTSKIYTSVDPALAKRGYYNRDGKWSESTMSFNQLVRIAATWRRADRKPLDPEITLFEVLDFTASAKLKADWGIDYFHLSKISGVWKIYNVIWQSHPVPAK